MNIFTLTQPIKKIGVGLFFSLSMNQYINSQEIAKQTRLLADNHLNVDSLGFDYKSNKKLYQGFELPTLVALSYYPELNDTKIEFVGKSIKTSMACRPKWNFLFKRKANRVYRIYINTDSVRVKGVMLADVPYNAQVGLIGHELAHVVDYSRSGIFKIIGMGVKYLFISGKCSMERRVDQITIEHHLGWQLYDFSDFVFNRSRISDKYKNYKRKIYYQPEDILLLIQQK